ncbi:hypothetical protein [Variovorax sp. SRS16]|uniref:hypothetical protein n=1 Tax=Variovorax sp. SRS16 TaxID=282217 RepID=UPI0013A56B98|nr:hypothetical protein [Variovorax sp. SRS16]
MAPPQTEDPPWLTLIASNLSGGASAAYLSLYAVGIETWRVMVMPASALRGVHR